jgi:hypothetical protein
MPNIGTVNVLRSYFAAKAGHWLPRKVELGRLRYGRGSSDESPELRKSGDEQEYYGIIVAYLVLAVVEA